MLLNLGLQRNFTLNAGQTKHNKEKFYAEHNAHGAGFQATEGVRYPLKRGKPGHLPDT